MLLCSPSRYSQGYYKKEEFPFFLDDSFVQYDDKRLAER